MGSKSFLTDPEEPLEGAALSDIYVDREGDWYYRGDKIIREDILQLFLSNLRLASEGVYIIDWRGQRCALGVADTPFIITRVDRVRLENEDREEIRIRLKHLPDSELLDPSTLRVGEGNVPYCTVRNGQFWARFSRPAYYQLAEWIECDNDADSFYFELNGTRFPIGGVGQMPAQDV